MDHCSHMKDSAGTVAGLCNQTFHAALLVGVGLQGFPDFQNHVGGGASRKRSGFCAEGPMEQPSPGALYRERGRDP